MVVSQETFGSSLFKSENNSEMQNVIKRLTRNITGLDDDLDAEKQLGRTLRMSLDEATKLIASGQKSHDLEEKDLL
jgi:hypothetical protein